MPDLRPAVAALAAAVSALCLPAIATSAHAAETSRPVVVLDDDWYGVAFSPNGDHVQDRARISFTLGAKSDVVVKIRRSNEARTLVRKERLGTLRGGAHTWVWKGRNSNGKVVKDGRYTAVLVAQQVAEDGRKKAVATSLYVDTTFDVAWAPRLSGDTVYPNTPGYATDFVGMTLDTTADDPMAALGAVVETIRDDQGRVVSTGRPYEYLDGDVPDSMPLAFRGFDARNDRLPAGTYRLRFHVRDLAGNRGRAKEVTVHVSDQPLVEVTGSVVVAPTAASSATLRSPRRGGDDPQQVPCGTVLPSTVYADPGAMSYRSSDACGDTWGRPSVATANGDLDLTSLLPPDVAPRGLRTSWVSMRGRPTVAGETDTARVSTSGGVSTSPFVTSAASAEETVTTSPTLTHPFEAPYFTDYVRRVRWTIETRGTDSFDVAAVTVSFSYLTPQA